MSARFQSPARASARLVETGTEAIMRVEFDRAWFDLNTRLRELESGAGLNAALRALETQQRENGFICAGLQALERHRFRHPQDPTRWFGVQYNPRRALRFKRSGQGRPFPSTYNDDCSLCRENIAWQQRGAQLGYQLKAGNRTYFALMNPFPLLPAHFVIAASEHRPQAWGFAPGGGVEVADLVSDLVSIVDRMPGHFGFYNGVDAGASIPGHLHYQLVMRPDDRSLFPLEAAVLDGDPRDDEPAFVAHYPLNVAVWRGRADGVVDRASEWIARWGERNRARLPRLSCNLIVTGEFSGEVVLYFVPRNRARSRTERSSVVVGGLEIFGEIVLTSAQEKAQLDAGQIDYFTLEAMLAGVHTPMEIDRSAETPFAP